MKLVQVLIVAALAQLPLAVHAESETESSAPAAEATSAGQQADVVKSALEAGGQGLVTSEGPEADVIKRVNAWAAAWSERDMSAYLASYTSEFKAKSASREKWEKQRAKRIADRKSLTVAIDNVSVVLLDESHAYAKFVQKYQSARYRDFSVKTLSLVKSGDAWLIEKETGFKCSSAKSCEAALEGKSKSKKKHKAAKANKA